MTTGGQIPIKKHYHSLPIWNTVMATSQNAGPTDLHFCTQIEIAPSISQKNLMQRQGHEVQGQRSRSSRSRSLGSESKVLNGVSFSLRHMGGTFLLSNIMRNGKNYSAIIFLPVKQPLLNFLHTGFMGNII